MKLYLGALLLIGACLRGQDTPRPSDAPPAAAAQDIPADQQPEAEYGGPAILSRGGGPTLTQGGELARLRPFLSVNGIYDTGLTGAVTQPDGTIRSTDGYGLESTFGVTGTHVGKKNIVELDYRGSLRHYTQNSYYDGFDNSLLLGYSQQLSPRLSINLSETAARYSRMFGMPMSTTYGGSFLSYDPTITGLTGNSLLDNPTLASISRGTLVYQYSVRNSFSFGGGGFIMRPQSHALIGANGYDARGDWSYRLTRYQTIGVAYSFGHFDFQNRYGQSDMHGVTLNYAVRMGRRWELGLAAGGLRIESVRLVKVTLDPLVSAILGQAYGISKFYGVSYIPTFGFHATRGFRRASASFGYDRTVVPGNGIFLTSTYQVGSAGFSYTGLRRVALQGGANYNQFSGLTQTLGRYRSASASAGFTKRLNHWLSMIGRVDARRYYVQNSQLNRVYYRAVFGFALSPGEYPLAIW